MSGWLLLSVIHTHTHTHTHIHTHKHTDIYATATDTTHIYMYVNLPRVTLAQLINIAQHCDIGVEEYNTLELIHLPAVVHIARMLQEHTRTDHAHPQTERERVPAHTHTHTHTNYTHTHAHTNYTHPATYTVSLVNTLRRRFCALGSFTCGFSMVSTGNSYCTEDTRRSIQKRKKEKKSENDENTHTCCIHTLSHKRGLR
jgi:hypothetical protein